MRIMDAVDLGSLIRTRRRRLGLTQADLAGRAGVSRRWLSDVEAGKDSAEFGLVLRALRALDLVVDIDATTRTPTIDLDAIIAAHTRPLT